jgi:mono/diheme cytochrome c family protein
MTRITAILVMIGVAGFGFQSEEGKAQESMRLEIPSGGADHGHAHSHGEHHWTAPKKERKRRNPLRATPATLRVGRDLYGTHCAGCHGAQGEGNGPAASGLDPRPPNLKAMAKLHSDGDLAWKIAQGRGAMPGWKNRLSPKQIWSLVHYLKRMD